MEALQRDSRADTHHRITRSWLPGTHLYAELCEVARGQAVCSCSLEFQGEVAKFRFLATNETCIEQPHARVSKSKRRAPGIGPVMVSMSNRWDLAESMLDDPLEVHNLISAFASARNT